MPSHLLGLVASLGMALAGPPSGFRPLAPADAVQIVRPPSASAYDGGAAHGAIRFACSRSLGAIRELLTAANLPFRLRLVRSQPWGHCHVYYEPTLPGFRASPDDHDVTELVFDTDSLAFLETGTPTRGDAVGAVGAVLRETDRPLAVSISVPERLPPSAYETAKAAHFGHLAHSVALRSGTPGASPGWAQDYVKAGTSSRGVTVLVPHALYEGDPANGPRYAELVERLARQDARVVRSKLSWEGGDLQFTLDPRDPRKLVLYYGGAAKPYWGGALTPAEYEYVLMLEFGADRAVDLSGLAPHVDYVVSFLPRHRTVLFAVPETGNRDVAASIAADLVDRFAGRDCPASLLELAGLLEGNHPLDEAAVRRAVERVRRDGLGSSLTVDRGLAERMQSFVEAHCPDRRSCFSTENQQRMLAADAELFGRWVATARRARSERAHLEALLELIEGQLDPVPAEVAERSRRKIAELEELGFRVVPVPALRVNMDEERGWPGVSYVNLLAIGDRLFVPQFGLGEAEERIFAKVAADLGPDYALVPVFARDVLVRSGGIHCLLGIIRAPLGARLATFGRRP